MDRTAELGRMLAGGPYRAGDAYLTELRTLARRRLQALQRTSPDDMAERERILRELFGAMGDNPEVEPPFFCDYGCNIRVGHQFFANFNCVILDCGPVDIGDEVMLAPAVQIYTVYHPLDPVERATRVELTRPVRIGNRVWIGGGVIILPGVTIGDGTTIGAGSVVARDVPPGVVAAGNPCRVLRKV